jgi:transcriptional regulator with XRE-family HTH domain
MKKTTHYGQLLRSLRETQGLTQQAVADRLKISRASYLALEQDKRELGFGEAKEIATLYQLSLDALAEQAVPNQDRYREMIHTFLRAGARDHITIKKTKLAQLLYLADMSWYYTHTVSMSNMPYRKYPFGPMADTFLLLVESLEAEGYMAVVQVTRADYQMYELEETRAGARLKTTNLSAAMIKHLEKIWSAWREATTAEITAFTTMQQPYATALDGDLIRYEAIKKEAPHLVC